jgi:hypothetical protein
MMEASLFILQFDDENDEDEDESLLLSSSTSSRREIAYCCQKRQRRRSKNDDQRRFDMFTIFASLFLSANELISARRVNLVSTDDTESWGASRIFLEESEYGHLIVNVRKQEIYLHCKLHCEKLNLFS